MLQFWLIRITAFQISDDYLAYIMSYIESIKFNRNVFLRIKSAYNTNDITIVKIS